MAEKVKAIPTGFHSVTAYMIVSDATKAIEFYKKAFGAEQRVIMHMPDGKGVMHAEIKIGDSIIMMGEENKERGCISPETAGVVTTSLLLYFENVDAAFDKAVKAGCTVKMPLMNMFWGDRYGQVTDPFGHLWALAQHIEDVPVENMGERAKEAFKQMAAAGV